MLNNCHTWNITEPSTDYVRKMEANMAALYSKTEPGCLVVVVCKLLDVLLSSMRD
uniref:Uncharacterized protein n=1 Tax=Arion vulgaris TaxID=1028688 RepID=A0A0B7B0V6_9EUPU